MRNVLAIQGVYYVVTGLWPLVSMGAFEWVTGPKVDDWLVRMVGLLAASIGASLWVGSRTERPGAAVLLLAVASALSFAAIDIRYVLAGRIRPIYLGDAVVEIGFMLLLAIAARGRRPA